MKSLYQELKKAKKDLRIAMAKNRELIAIVEKEITDAILPILQKYQDSLDELQALEKEKYNEVCDIADEYYALGKFNTLDIVSLITVFVSYIEGEKFVPYLNTLNSPDFKQCSVIVRESINQDLLTNYETFKSLYDNGDILFLDYQIEEVVSLYNDWGTPNFSIGKFSYLYEFFNRLMEYRTEKAKMTLEDLYEFMCNFILTHPRLAMENKAKRDEMLATNDDMPITIECQKLEQTIKLKRSKKRF